MTLADYKPPEKVINLPGGQTVTVRGLTLDHLSILAQGHLPDVERLYAVYQRVSAGKSPEQITPALAVALVKEAPVAVAGAIVLAAGEEGEAAWAGVRKLPFPTQVELLREIAELTFADHGGPKNFFASLRSLLPGVA